MVFTTFDIENEVVEQSTRSLKVSVNMSCQLEDFLLCDSYGIIMVQATHVNMLQCIVVLIDLVKDLPSDIEFDSLSHNFELIPVLLLVELTKIDILSYRLIDFVVEFMLCPLHFLVKNSVVFLGDHVVPIKFLLRSEWS